MKKVKLPRTSTNTECAFDELFRKRAEVFKEKKALLEANPKLTQAQRLHDELQLAEDNLIGLYFNCDHLHHFVKTLFGGKNQVILQHPKHPLDLFILQPANKNSLSLLLVDTTTNKDGHVPNFELKLKLARRLQDPSRTFDTFFELFGLPKD